MLIRDQIVLMKICSFHIANLLGYPSGMTMVCHTSNLEEHDANFAKRSQITHIVMDRAV